MGYNKRKFKKGKKSRRRKGKGKKLSRNYTMGRGGGRM